MKEKIEALCAENPDVTQAMAADALGVTRQRISQACKRYGIRLANGKLTPRTSLSVCKPSRWPVPLNASTKGAVGELIVSADLMSRGFFVYRCLSSTGPFDLVAVRDGEMFRIEVRCGHIDSEKRLQYAQPQDGRYDVLAIALSDGVRYKPETFILP